VGYSSRYHAASLAAVFAALAIGILIGAGFGQDVVSNTSDSLKKSLEGDLRDARAEVDDLNAELDSEHRFSDQAYPALVDGRLQGQKVGLVAIGGLPPGIFGDVEAMLEPTGATLAAVAVVRQPPDTRGLANSLEGTRFERVDRDLENLEDLGRIAGRELVTGGRLIDDTRDQLLTRFSGGAERLDAVVIVRDPPDDLNPDEQDAADSLESGLVDGIRDAGDAVVGVERSDTDPSSIEFFASHEVSTSDSIDLVPGRVAAVFVLLGANGNFGTKDTADQLLPDLLVPATPGK
jgi:hypothetical protein